jgi:catechol 2,3-dioxygenase-like lactoylglutathione lyase family enzyme
VNGSIDHLILPVNEPLADSLAFYCGLLGFARDDEQGPFQGVRVSPSFLILLSPYGSRGGMHLAFNLAARRFDEIFAVIRAKELPYGDRFDDTSNGNGRRRHNPAQRVTFRRSICLIRANTSLNSGASTSRITRG